MRQVSLRCNWSWWSLQVILGHNLPWCDSMLEMAKVKFEYFKENLVVLEIEVSSKRRWWRPRAILTWWQDWFLPCSDVKGWAILSWWEDWFLPCQMWVLSHSDVTVGLVPTWSNISVECRSWNGGTWLVNRNTQLGAEMPFSGRMEAPGQLPGILGLGLRALPMRCVLTWSNVSAERL